MLLTDKAPTDLEHLQVLSSKEILAAVFLHLLTYAESEAKENPAQFLGFKDDEDYKLYRAAIDLLEDSQYAINEFLIRGLFTTNDSFQCHGERYLRLYGLLNAAFLQVSSIETLLNLFNHPERRRFNKQLNKLALLRARHMAGSHTLSMRENNKVAYYRIVQSNVDKWGTMLVLASEASDVSRINLVQAVREYEALSLTILFQLARERVGIRVSPNDQIEEWFRLRLECVRIRIEAN